MIARWLPILALLAATVAVVIAVVVFVRLDGQAGRAAQDRNAQCEALQVLIDRQQANLDPEIVKSVFRPLRDADPEKFDAALGRARADLRRLVEVQRGLACLPP